MKAVGIGLLALCVAAFGWLKSTSLRRQVNILEAAETLCRRAGEEMRFVAPPPAELMAILSGASTLRELPFLAVFQEVEPERFHSVWRREIAAFCAQNGVDSEAASLLSEFGAGLGTTDLQSQQTHCDAFAARFARLKSAALTAYTEKSKLYVSLGGIGAAAVALIFI